ncbi:Retrovirus-related Pol polyprotein from transposon TNT 1-94 [Vitis vinifera]|uniref:Retrovirus-related Pol polyprotein from transposon TNT 1-94 n=1 Tax=Vitis vinifera TaxID=29760 RepID=A0A438K1L2_VITVI|nr:Retrovirus-related Pol polyprotein from transposon TNT 1-94 [Vitis vinifera]
MPSTPQQNDVAERRNRTLMEMVRSMMSYSPVPISLWGEALKTAIFYCPNHSVRIVETRNAKFLENGEISGSNEPRKVDIEEIRVDIPPPFLPQEIIAPQPVQQVEEHEQHNRDGSLPPENIAIENVVEPPQLAPLRRSQRERRPAISDDYVTKRDAKGNIECFKAKLVAKGFTQKEGIDYRDTFSPVSKKDSLKIIMALVAHFDLELHQMDVKTTFLNGNLDEDIYMEQPEGFAKKGNEHLVCKLKKSIYGLKQASRQWCIKFNNTITSFGFKENTVDQCIYLKISGSKFIFLILYVDDILLASSDLGLLRETKEHLSKNFQMVDMGEANYVIGIEIFRNRSRGVLGLSQKGYIDRVLERFNMQSCSSGVAPILKGDKLSKKQCLRNNMEREQMKKIPYASVVGSLMYAQTCTRLDISFDVGMLGRYQSDP